MDFTDLSLSIALRFESIDKAVLLISGMSRVKSNAKDTLDSFVISSKIQKQKPHKNHISHCISL